MKTWQSRNFIILPKDQRIGQAFENFRRWLDKKGYEKDTFYLSDKDFKKLWNEYLKD